MKSRIICKECKKSFRKRARDKFGNILCIRCARRKWGKYGKINLLCAKLSYRQKIIS